MKSPTSSIVARWRRTVLSEHILRMSGYHNHLTQLDSVIGQSSSITATKLQKLRDEL